MAHCRSRDKSVGLRAGGVCVYILYNFYLFMIEQSRGSLERKGTLTEFTNTRKPSAKILSFQEQNISYTWKFGIGTL